MPVATDVSKIIEKVKKLLTKAEANDVHLGIESHKLDDDWLYIVVAPTRPGIRASDHADTMTWIERELRKEGDDNVLLVPVLTNL